MMVPLDGPIRPAGMRRRPQPSLAGDRRAALIHDVAARLLVPALAARFGAPQVGAWRRDAAALSATLAEGTLAEGIAAPAALNPGGRMFRPICRDIILPAAVAPGMLPADPGALDLDGCTGSAIEAAVVAETALRLRRSGLRA